jgi:misacylated tRNA(Ala) deacylase
MTDYDQRLYTADAYLARALVNVVESDPDERRIAVDRTIFYPGGGGQPADRGTVGHGSDSRVVTKVAEIDGVLWHWLDGDPFPVGTCVEEALDWSHRHLLMRTHSAMHVLCGVVFRQFSAPTTGANMEPGRGRIDFAAPDLGAHSKEGLETEINREIDAAREIVVSLMSRGEVDEDPALIRAKAHLLPRSIDPVRIVDIEGLDRQADGGTHVGNTKEIGRVVVTRVDNKGANNRRVKIELADATASA